MEFAFWDLIFLIFNFLFYTLDLYVWKNNDRIIDFCCFKLFDGTYNGRLHCIVGVLPTCYKRKAAIYFYSPGGTGLIKALISRNVEHDVMNKL